MIPDDSRLDVLRKELIDQLTAVGYRIIAAKNTVGFEPPPALKNDGYGDQKNKRPDIVALDPLNKFYIVGIVRTGDGDIESDESLTEYNVFLDQIDKTTRTPFRLWIIAPAKAADELTVLMTRYIHPDRIPQITIVKSSTG